MHATYMRRNRPILEDAPWDIVSPRSRGGYRSDPVLAVWPDDRVLELAEHMALRSALCVIPYEARDIAGWVERTGATAVIAGFEAPAREPVAPEVEEELRHVVSFGGHNGFLGGGEKEVAIRSSHRMRPLPSRPTRETLEDYLRSTGEVDADGVTRLSTWWEEVLAGKRHRDYRGEVMR